MSMDKHIFVIVKSCIFQLRDFHHILPFISKTAAITLANAFVHSHLDYCFVHSHLNYYFVHSHLDYCNSLFYGLPKYSIHHLQKIQNIAARIVTRTSRFTHITPILKSLHWFPILYRIHFKICCLAHRAVSLSEPYYLRSLLSNRLNSHSLYSSPFNPFVVSCFKKVYNGICSFFYAALFWYHLPNTIRSAHTYMSFRKKT